MKKVAKFTDRDRKAAEARVAAKHKVEFDLGVAQAGSTAAFALMAALLATLVGKKMLSHPEVVEIIARARAEVLKVTPEDGTALAALEGLHALWERPAGPGH